MGAAWLGSAEGNNRPTASTSHGETGGNEDAEHDELAHVLDLAAGGRTQLLARIYEAFPLRCPECGSTMRILAFLTDPVGAILRHLDLPHTPPRLSHARGPPQPAFDLDAGPATPVEDPLPADDLDQTPAFDPADPEPVPELHLDQTPVRLNADLRPTNTRARPRPGQVPRIHRIDRSPQREPSSCARHHLS